LSGLLIVVGLLIRMRILETPLFAALKENKEVAEAPVSETIRRHWRDLLLIAGTRIAENATFYLFTASAIAYGSEVLHVDTGVILLAVNVAAAVEFFTIPLFGMLSDRLSRRHTYVIGCLFLMGFAFPFYALFETRDTGWIVVATVVGLAGGHALLYSVQASLIPELFGTRLRCTGASIGYQLAVPLAGGLAPLIAAVLIKTFPDQYWPLACYVMLISLISLACVVCLSETSRKDIT
jgi:MHS family shikimate/dehydroshikimate transporter-like MFS transporter